MAKIRDTLYENQYTFMTMSRSVPFKMKSISNKVVETIKTHLLGWTTFFLFSLYTTRSSPVSIPRDTYGTFFLAMFITSSILDL